MLTVIIGLLALIAGLFIVLIGRLSLHDEQIKDLNRRLSEHEVYGGTWMRLRIGDHDSPIIMELTIEDLINLSRLNAIKPPELLIDAMGKSRLSWQLPQSKRI